MLVVVVVFVVVGVGVVVEVLLLVVDRVLVGAVVLVLVINLLHVIMFLSEHTIPVNFAPVMQLIMLLKRGVVTFRLLVNNLPPLQAPWLLTQGEGSQLGEVEPIHTTPPSPPSPTCTTPPSPPSPSPKSAPEGPKEAQRGPKKRQ